ncbi:metallophosphoesterase [Streptomyces sp. NPDC096030]|uniref:metallophosphoesterase n=1 Tax=Streptomyces sp. NPDC096030 TaxID=3155423 RepID=UPI00332550D4
MTQGAGQEPVVRTATLRDFRVPPYARVPVQGQAPEPPAGHPVVPYEPGAPVDPGAPGEPVAPVAHGAPLETGAHGERVAHEASFERVDFAKRVEVVEPVEHVGRVEHVEPAEHLRPVEYVEPIEAVAPSEPAPPARVTVTDPTLLLGRPSSALSALTTLVTPAAATPGHPGNAFPDDQLPEGYTPTERDLPVINRGDTVQVHVDPAAAPAPAPAGEGPGPLWVVGDVHGYLDELVEALRERRLIDENGAWAAGNARLWFLGDFTDRGPDGIGVIDLVMRLSAEAAAAGGYCKALMGNHELLLIGAKRFGDTPVNSGAGTATFQAAWLLNGGQKHDMDRLQDVHLQWMSRLDAVVEEDGHLLMHSDTTAYLDYGSTIEDVNETVHEIINRNDADEVWDLFRKFTKRFAFRDDTGPQAVQELLATYGGGRVVHGHSPIPYLLGQVGTEDGEASSDPVVDGPHVYADGLAIAMDGGVTMAGKLLVVQLPLHG